ncbi:MAG TPA: tetratricopeptide repeat protein [Thermoanaerobaculia bacterium]|nr:tetratricopeptide repeat protein [Thermoanaerobaculia bacterium]
MSRLRNITTVFFLLLVIPSLAFAAKGRLIGKVVGPDGKPLEGVTVTVTSPDIASFKEVETTDRKGVFVVDFRKIDVTYHYRFDKTGYQSLEAQQLWEKEGSQMYDWTMPVAEVDVTAVDTAVAPVSTSAPAVEAFNEALIAFRARNYAAAEPLLRAAVEHDPNLRQGWEALAVSQFELGQHQAAAASAEKAIALGSTEPTVYQARWQAYRNLNDVAKTAEALQDLEKIGRRSEEAKRIHNEAVALGRAGNHEAAFAKFQEALTVDPNLQPALLGLATAGSKIGRNEEAAKAAEAILAGDPNDEAAARIRFNAVLALGDKKRIADALMGIARYEPIAARDGILRLAFEAYDASDNATAADHFRKVIQIDPKYPQAYYYLGVISASQGATGEARRHIERFLQLAPNDPEAKSARDMLQYLK